jgi:septal ring factor EnvC (AmiA/AmiB activator)|tara:strand:+ start:28 stop:342 length:315 start_codon:yes stop_codon:yes gene_type:complete
MEWLKKLVVAILGLFGLSTLLSANKSKEVKELGKVIKENKKKTKEVVKKIEKLQVNKNKNKKEITNLKRKLTRTKNEVKKMEVTYENDDVEDAADFLRKFSKSK